MYREALAAVADWLKLRDRDPCPLFLPVDKDRRTLAHRRLHPSTIRLACRRRAAQAGLRAFSPHDLRRTSISDLLDLTGDLALVSELAGHANPATTRKYDRRPAESRRRAACSLHVPYQRRPHREEDGRCRAADREPGFAAAGAVSRGSLTIGPGEKSGTVDADLFNSNPNARTEPRGNVHVRGSWWCH